MTKYKTLFCLCLVLQFSVICRAQPELDLSELNNGGNLDMGNNENLLPPDFNSNPFPNQPGFDPFSNNNRFSDPSDPGAAFRNPVSSTEDPFRSNLQSTTEVDFNQFQNNELGNNPDPIDPFPQNRNRNRYRPTLKRLEVDEFGNPLGENIKKINTINRLPFYTILNDS